MNDSLEYKIIAKGADGKIREKVLQGLTESQIREKLNGTPFTIISIEKIPSKVESLEILFEENSPSNDIISKENEIDQLITQDSTISTSPIRNISVKIDSSEKDQAYSLETLNQPKDINENPVNQKIEEIFEIQQSFVGKNFRVFIVLLTLLIFGGFTWWHMNPTISRVDSWVKSENHEDVQSFFSNALKMNDDALCKEVIEIVARNQSFTLAEKLLKEYSNTITDSSRNWRIISKFIESPANPKGKDIQLHYAKFFLMSTSSAYLSDPISVETNTNSLKIIQTFYDEETATSILKESLLALLSDVVTNWTSVIARIEAMQNINTQSMTTLTARIQHQIDSLKVKVSTYNEFETEANQAAFRLKRSLENAPAGYIYHGDPRVIKAFVRSRFDDHEEQWEIGSPFKTKAILSTRVTKFSSTGWFEMPVKNVRDIDVIMNGASKSLPHLEEITHEELSNHLRALASVQTLQVAEIAASQSKQNALDELNRIKQELIDKIRMKLEWPENQLQQPLSLTDIQQQDLSKLIPKGYRCPNSNDLSGEWVEYGAGNLTPWRSNTDINEDGYPDHASILIGENGFAVMLYISVNSSLFYPVFVTKYQSPYNPYTSFYMSSLPLQDFLTNGACRRTAECFNKYTDFSKTVFYLGKYETEGFAIGYNKYTNQFQFIEEFEY